MNLFNFLARKNINPLFSTISKPNMLHSIRKQNSPLQNEDSASLFALHNQVSSLSINTQAE